MKTLVGFWGGAAGGSTAFLILKGAWAGSNLAFPKELMATPPLPTAIEGQSGIVSAEAISRSFSGRLSFWAAKHSADWPRFPPAKDQGVAS
jgi:hypothetical protein